MNMFFFFFFWKVYDAHIYGPMYMNEVVIESLVWDWMTGSNDEMRMNTGVSRFTGPCKIELMWLCESKLSCWVRVISWFCSLDTCMCGRGPQLISPYYSMNLQAVTLHYGRNTMQFKTWSAATNVVTLLWGERLISLIWWGPWWWYP